MNTPRRTCPRRSRRLRALSMSVGIVLGAAGTTMVGELAHANTPGATMRLIERAMQTPPAPAETLPQPLDSSAG